MVSIWARISMQLGWHSLVSNSAGGPVEDELKNNRRETPMRNWAIIEETGLSVTDRRSRKSRSSEVSLSGNVRMYCIVSYWSIVLKERIAQLMCLNLRCSFQLYSGPYVRESMGMNSLSFVWSPDIVSEVHTVIGRGKGSSQREKGGTTAQQGNHPLG